MSKSELYTRLQITRAEQHKALAVLIDPDGLKIQHLDQTLDLAAQHQADYLFVGGSLILDDALDYVLSEARKRLDCPLMLFPGNPQQIHPLADGLLLLSLVSGRNPDLLIGRHVEAAMRLHRSGLEILPTAYMLVDGGRPTSVSYMSNTQALPRDKPDLALCTALAAQLLGLKLLYLDAGSGAEQPVPPAMIARIRTETQLPLIVGGGLRHPEQLRQAYQAGADLAVVGNILETQPKMLAQLAEVRASYSY